MLLLKKNFFCCNSATAADSLPADIVSMRTMYLSAEFMDIDNDGLIDFFT